MAASDHFLVHIKGKATHGAEPHNGVDAIDRSVTIRATRSKWGSCNGRNDLSLSLYLMTLPEHLRDFVILHELCHTVHHDHSPRFHALLDRLVGGKEKLLNKELRSYRAY